MTQFFLNFSRDLEESVGALAEGAPYDYIIERLMELKLIPEPLGAWEYGAKPILMALRGILQKKPNVKIYCYRDPSYDFISSKIAEKIAIMIFRVSSIERIETEEWEAVLNSLLEAEAKALPEETGLIMKMAESCENCICVAGFDGRRIRARLMEEDSEVSLAYMYVPYHFTPPKILMREMR